MLGDGEDVLIAAAAHVHDKQIVLGQGRRELGDERERVCGLERWDDALKARAELESLERLLVGDGDVARATLLLEPGMLGANPRIVEAGRDRMAFQDLSVRILQ